MRHGTFAALLAGACAAGAVGPAWSDSFALGDYFFDQDKLSSGFSSVTNGGVGYTVTGPGAGYTILLEGTDWSGQYFKNATILYDNGASGALTITFSSPVASIGDLAVQPKAAGAYTATLTAYDGSTELGTSSYSSISAFAEATLPSFTFSAPEITSVVITTTNDSEGFAVGNPTFDGGGIPEPGTWALLFTGLGVLGAGLRRAHRPLAGSIS